MKRVGDFPEDCIIFIYKNPRRIVFRRFKHRKYYPLANSLIEGFMNSIFILCYSLPLVIISTILSGKYANFFPLFYWLFLFIGLSVIPYMAYHLKWLSEIYPTFTNTCVRPLKYLEKIVSKRGKRQWIIRNLYTDKFSLPINTSFMFLHYKVVGDWEDYKKIKLRKLYMGWVFDIFLNKIAKNGYLKVWVE